MSAQPPVVDLEGLAEGRAAAFERVAREATAAGSEWGLFHATGHGIPDAELRAFETAMRALFALPPEEKAAMRRSRENAWGWYDAELTKNRPDWKEVFDYGPEWPDDARRPAHSDGTNRWPASAPELLEPLRAHFAHCEKLARALLRALCAGIGLAPDRLDSAFAQHTSYQRLNHYAPCPDAAPPEAELVPERGRLAVHHHTDAGALTVLHADADVAGLQVQHSGRLVTVEPLPGALVVNLGDMLQVWSNDALVSPVHRVVAHPDRERYSAPFFLNPAYDTVVEPLPERLRAGEIPHYRPVSWARFRDARSAGDYADQGPEIQIQSFRL